MRLYDKSNVTWYTIDSPCTLLQFSFLQVLQVNDTSQLLDPIEKQISLLNHFSVLCVLEIWSRADNDTAVLVNLGRETVRRNESGGM